MPKARNKHFSQKRKTSKGKSSKKRRLEASSDSEDNEEKG